MPATLASAPALSPPPAAPAAAAIRPAQELLRASPRGDLRRLTAVENAVEVVLVGRVPSYHLKQLAIELVRPAAAGRVIVIRIVVGG